MGARGMFPSNHNSREAHNIALRICRRLISSRLLLNGERVKECKENRQKEIRTEKQREPTGFSIVHYQERSPPRYRKGPPHAASYLSGQILR